MITIKGVKCAYDRFRDIPEYKLSNNVYCDYIDEIELIRKEIPFLGIIEDRLTDRYTADIHEYTNFFDPIKKLFIMGMFAHRNCAYLLDLYSAFIGVRKNYFSIHPDWFGLCFIIRGLDENKDNVMINLLHLFTGKELDAFFWPFSQEGMKKRKLLLSDIISTLRFLLKRRLTIILYERVLEMSKTFRQSNDYSFSISKEVKAELESSLFSRIKMELPELIPKLIDRGIEKDERKWNSLNEDGFINRIKAIMNKLDTLHSNYYGNK
jgi:hypothetical protein